MTLLWEMVCDCDPLTELLIDVDVAFDAEEADGAADDVGATSSSSIPAKISM